MPKGAKRGREEAEDYDSDGGFVANDDDDGQDVAPKKKSKKAPTSAKGKDVADEKFWELSTGRNPRRVAISQFKDAHLINIREFYEKNDEFLPGKKGISLNIEQYQAFLRAVPEINAALKEMGIQISGAAETHGDVMDDGEKPKKRSAVKKESRANIEATSDEDEGE